MPAKQKPRKTFAGEKARAWRRGVGARADNLAEDVRARKFPLDLQLPGPEGGSALTPADFAAAAKLFDIVEGAGETGPGALAGFLCAVHLSGFRLFSRVADGAAIAGDDGRRLIPMPPEAAEYELHKVAALVARELRAENAEAPKKVTAGELQTRILGLGKDKHPDGLAWLFAAGLRRLSGDKNAADIADIADELGADIARVRQLRRRVVDMPPPFCGEEHYADFRNPVAGKLKSWLANYWKRLELLRQRMDEVRQAAATAAPEERRTGDLFASGELSPNRLRPDARDAVRLLVLPDELRDELAQELFAREDFSPDDLHAAADALPGALQQAGEALDILAGRHPHKLPGKAEAEAFDELNARMGELAGRLNKLRNFADHRARNADKKDEKFWNALAKGLEKSAKPLGKWEKLNRISGGTPDPGEEVQAAQDAFNALWNHRRDHFARIAPAALGIPALLAAAEAKEAETLQKCDPDSLKTPAELAVRKLLDDIGNDARRMRPENREAVAALLRPLFARRKDANRYFVNNQGAIYRSPRSTSIFPEVKLRKRPRKQKPEKARDWLTESVAAHGALAAAAMVDWPAELEKLAADIAVRFADDPQQDPRRRQDRAADFRDWLALSERAMTLRLQSLPEELSREQIPALAALADLTALPRPARDALRFSPSLADALNAAVVPRRVVVAAFNQFHSALRGRAFKITRPGFVVRLSFKLKGQDELLYAPKPRQWNPLPRHRLRYAGTFAAMKPAANDRGALDSPQAVAELLKARRRPTRARANAELSEEDRAVLAVMPHAWFFPVGKLQINAPMQTGVIVEKDAAKQKEFAPPEKPFPALRLQGPNSLKTALDDCLRGRARLGESTLILERVCRQNFQWRDNRLVLNADEQNLRAELAVPVKTILDPKNQGPALERRLVAIDLGERGIGYAVFHLPDWLNGDDPRAEKLRPIKSGAVAIPSMRALIRAVNRHRGRAQPMQKVRDAHSRDLEKRRDNVAGEVCNAIDALCAKWRAFPVLEKDIRNLESGGRQLKLVYAGVLNRYAKSKVDAHKKQRAGHWFTGKTPWWEHPFLAVKNGDSLFLAPGATVNAAGTSQRCSRCGRNPLSELWKLNLPNNREVEFRNGEADLAAPDDDNAPRLLKGKPKSKPAELRVFLRARPDLRDPREQRRQQSFRRRRARAPLARPLHGKIPAGKLRALIKFNLRRPPSSLRSRDTSQSQYNCVLCRARMHADINAAVNIGRRFLAGLNHEASRKKFAAADEVQTHMGLGWGVRRASGPGRIVSVFGNAGKRGGAGGCRSTASR